MAPGTMVSCLPRRIWSTAKAAPGHHDRAAVCRFPPDKDPSIFGRGAPPPKVAIGASTAVLAVMGGRELGRWRGALFGESLSQGNWPARHDILLTIAARGHRQLVLRLEWTILSAGRLHQSDERLREGRVITMSAELLAQAIALSQAGRQQEARELLVQVITADVHSEPAWLLYANALPDEADRVRALEECLRHNPSSKRAQEELAALKGGRLPSRRQTTGQGPLLCRSARNRLHRHEDQAVNIIWRGLE